MKRQIVFTGITFTEALTMAAPYKVPCKFYNGVSWSMTSDNYQETTQREAQHLSEQPGVSVIFSRPVGSRGCEIIVQD